MIKDISHIRRLPRLGCIRLGIKLKTKQGKAYPKEVDYFILDPDTASPEENKNLVTEFHDLYGEKPKSIKIMFPVADPEKYFPQNYKRYGSSTSLKCIGDGETAECTKEEFSKGLQVLGKSEIGLTRVVCEGKTCIYAKKECSPIGVLRVLLPELEGAGVWQITTGSFNSIVSLNSCIDYITALCGRAHMIPLVLERRPQETAYEGKKATHYILHINVGFKLADIQKIAQTAPSEISLSLPSVETVEESDVMTEPVEPASSGKEISIEDNQGVSTDIVCQESNEQLTKLSNLAKKLGLDKEAYVKILAEAGFTTLKDMTTEIYDKINKKLDDYKPNAFGEEGADKTAEQKELESFSEGEDLSEPADQETKTENQDGTENATDFFTFMNRANAELLKLTGDRKRYNTELETFSVRFLTELKGKTKKQADMRTHFEALLVETRKLNGVSEPV